MKLVWSPETASKAYIDTVKTCKDLTESEMAELLSATAAGWNTKLIVEWWSHGNPIATSIGLAVAARHTCGRHLCMVPDQASRKEYITAMHKAGIDDLDVMVGEPEELMPALAGVDFLVMDSKRRDFARVLRLADLSQKGAVLACKNARGGDVSDFRWHGVLGRGTRVVRSVFLPVGRGLDVAHIGSSGGREKVSSRWIKHIDQRSGEEHLFRG